MNFRPKYKYIISHLRFFNQNISLISSFHLSEFSPKIYIFNVIFVNFHPKYTCLISSNANIRVELWKNVLTINKPFLSKFSPNLILSERQRRHIWWISKEAFSRSNLCQCEDQNVLLGVCLRSSTATGEWVINVNYALPPPYPHSSCWDKQRKGNILNCSFGLAEDDKNLCKLFVETETGHPLGSDSDWSLLQLLKG